MKQFVVPVQRRRLAAILTASAILGTGFNITGIHAASASTAKSVTGAFGQVVSVPKVKLSGKAQLRVTGKGFDETIGIYLAYCVLPKKGSAPTPCGGGANKDGVGDISFWISSNAPPYASGLAIPFQAGGSFAQTLTVSKKIGDINCYKVKCAIAVRSDNLREGDRTNDLFIPIKFVKKSPNKKS